MDASEELLACALHLSDFYNAFSGHFFFPENMLMTNFSFGFLVVLSCGRKRSLKHSTTPQVLTFLFSTSDIFVGFLYLKLRVFFSRKKKTPEQTKQASFFAICIFFVADAFLEVPTVEALPNIVSSSQGTYSEMASVNRKMEHRNFCVLRPQVSRAFTNFLENARNSICSIHFSSSSASFFFEQAMHV